MPDIYIQCHGRTVAVARNPEDAKECAIRMSKVTGAVTFDPSTGHLITSNGETPWRLVVPNPLEAVSE